MTDTKRPYVIMMPSDQEVEDYIRQLPWSDEATDHEKTLVGCNIRSFYSWVKSNRGIKSCPKCGSSDVEIRYQCLEGVMMDFHDSYGQCHKCGFEGPHKAKYAEARDEWNSLRREHYESGNDPSDVQGR